MNKFCNLKTTAVLFFLFCLIVNIPLKAHIIHPYTPGTDSLKITHDSLFNKDHIDLAVFGEFIFPIPGKVISHYGKRGQQNHPGTDIKLAHGDTVRAAFQGIVTRAMHYYGYGNLVVLNHGQHTETYYAHLSKILVNTGDTISEGTVVGLGGRTGRATCDHLHFEVRVNGNTYNPEMLFDFNNHQVLSSFISLHQTNSPRLRKHNRRREEVIATTMALPAVNSKSSEETSSEIYIIRKNDSLYSLAKRYGTTVKSLCLINGLSTASKLKVGYKLKIN